MKKSWALAHAVALVAAGAVLGVAERAQAQFCTTLDASSFQKAVVDLNGPPLLPGDIVEYTIRACNSSGATCSIPRITDNIDGLLNPDTMLPTPRNPPEKRDLNFLPFTPASIPAPEGCSPNPVGNALCRKGPINTADPRTLPASAAGFFTRCGEDCVAPTDQINMFVSNTASNLAPNECFFMIYRAQVADNTVIDESECLCNVAIFQAPGNPPPTPFFSHDLNWASLAGNPSAPGCADAATCRTPGPSGCTLANTCLRVTAAADVGSVSEKCIAGTPCGTVAAKAPGEAVTYNVSIENVGTVTAKGVTFRDSMTQQSDKMTNCIDFTTPTKLPTTANLKCSWAASCGVTVMYDPASMAVVLSAPIDIPAGGKMTFDIVAFVDPAASGNCTNNWALGSGNPPNPVNRTKPNPVFKVDSQANLSTSTKCVKELPSSPCDAARTIINPLPATIQYQIVFANTGNLKATSVTLLDDLTSLGAGCTGSLTTFIPNNCTPIGDTCGAGATCTIALTPPFPATISDPAEPPGSSVMRPGCMVDIKISATIPSTMSGTCCNIGQADITDASQGRRTIDTPQACFTVGTPTATLELAKGLQPGQSQTPAPDTDVFFEVSITNTSTSAAAKGITLVDTLAACFDPLGPDNAPCGATVVTCLPAVDCPPIASTCRYSNGGKGFTITPFDLAAGKSVTFTVRSHVPRTANGRCTNSASLTAPAPLGPRDASVTVTPQAVLNIEKIAVPTNVPASTARAGKFVITVRNTGTANATGCVVTDDVDAGLPAGCLTLADCVGNHVPPLPAFPTCNVAPGDSMAVSPPFSVAVNGTQVIELTYNTTAITGTCENNVTVSCTGGTATGFSGKGSTSVGSAGACELAYVANANAISRVNPWAYTSVCAPMNTLNAATKVLPNPTNNSDMVGQSYTSAVPNLTLYQQTCGTTCTNILKFVKNRTSSLTRIYIQ